MARVLVLEPELELAEPEYCLGSKNGFSLCQKSLMAYV
jgi:hypothetical protein